MTNEVQALLNSYAKAVYEKDVEQYCSLYSKDMQSYDSWMPWKFSTLESWKRSATEWFTSVPDTEKVKVIFDDVRSVGNGVSAKITFQAEDLSGKKIRSVDNRLTWITQNGKIVHQHTSVPYDLDANQAIFHEPK